MSYSKKKKKSTCDHTEKVEGINFADVGKAILLKEDGICKGPLFHMRNKVVTEEEKKEFLYRKLTQEYLETVVDHNTALRFLFNDQQFKKRLPLIEKQLEFNVKYNNTRSKKKNISKKDSILKTMGLDFDCCSKPS